MSTKYLLLALRLALGWLFFYAGITKVLNPSWSAAFYLKTAKTFPGLFQAMLDPSILPYINFFNKWGLTLIGVSLILGIFVRWSALAGIVMMLLYYFPVLDFPKAGDHSYIVDDHIIYAIALALLAASQAGRFWGVDSKLRKR